MKTLSLNVAQRIQLVSFLNTFQDKSYETLVHVWKLLDKCSIGEDEKSLIGLKVENNQIVWDNSKSLDLKVEFSSDEEKAFSEEFESRSKENKLDVSQYNLAQIYTKLKEHQEKVETTEPSGLD